MSRSTFLPAAVIAISALAGCAGGPEQPATAPVAEHDSPGEGRKPASGAWLEHRYGDWSAEHGSATERHFQQGEAFGQTEQLTQPTVRGMVNKDNDADVRSNPLLTSGGDAEPKSFGEAWCSAQPELSVCFVQLDGGNIELVGTNANRAVIGALATDIYEALSDDPDTPEPTESPAPDNPGENRKSIEGKTLPRTVGEWEVVGGGSDHQAVYGRPGAARMSDGALVSLQKGDLDARRLASLIKSAEQHEEAWCQTVGSNLQCYVQLDGGVLQVVEGDNQPAGDAPALANALYEAL